jgi:excisionase family DNA binding protein
MNTSRLLYSRREAAQLLSLSLRTIDQLISEHKLMIRKVGKRVLVRADSLAKYAGDYKAEGIGAGNETNR